MKAIRAVLWKTLLLSLSDLHGRIFSIIPPLLEAAPSPGSIQIRLRSVIYVIE